MAYFDIGYQVTGVDYDYQCYNLNKRFSTSTEAKEYVNKITNTEHPINTYYNPSNPSQSSITQGFKYSSIIPIIVGVGMVIVSYLTLVGTIKWT